jgi:hypothetical protein
MADMNGTQVIEEVEVKKAKGKKAPEKAPEQIVEKGPEQTVEKAPEIVSEDDAALMALMGEDEDEDDVKILKWRFLAKGPALQNILKVFGARAKEGDKQVSFVVGTGDKARELGDVARRLFEKLADAGVTLRDILALTAPKK